MSLDACVGPAACVSMLEPGFGATVEPGYGAAATYCRASYVWQDTARPSSSAALVLPSLRRHQSAPPLHVYSPALQQHTAPADNLASGYERSSVYSTVLPSSLRPAAIAIHDTSPRVLRPDDPHLMPAPQLIPSSHQPTACDDLLPDAEPDLCCELSFHPFHHPRPPAIKVTSVTATVGDAASLGIDFAHPPSHSVMVGTTTVEAGATQGDSVCDEYDGDAFHGFIT